MSDPNDKTKDLMEKVQQDFKDIIEMDGDEPILEDGEFPMCNPVEDHEDICDCDCCRVYS